MHTIDKILEEIKSYTMSKKLSLTISKKQSSPAESPLQLTAPRSTVECKQTGQGAE